MSKYHLTIEFRYHDVPKKNIINTDYKSKTITIGVYDDFDEACLNGNKLLENLESKFKLHTFPNGNVAKKERFSKNGGCFGSKKTLISDLAYLKTPFTFYAKITTLNYDDINNVIDEVTDSVKRSHKYKLSLQD